MSIKGREFINEITSYIFIEDEPEKADIIFVPGGLWCEPTERAAQLYSEGYAPKILLSGKYSLKYNCFTHPESNLQKYNKIYNTEFEFMEDILLLNGVKKEFILKEDAATWTKENAVNSRIVTDNFNLNIKKAIICCKSFHAKRCLMFYSLSYPNTKFLVCPVDIDNINKNNWFESEHGINEVMGELSRCGGQFKKAIPFWR